MSQDMPFSPFLADILTAQVKATQNATNRVIENLDRNNAVLEATLQLITEDIDFLCTRPYVPNPGDVRRKLYPSEERVQKRVKENEEAAS